MPIVYEGKSDYISRDTNYILNGNFDFWQRATSVTMAGGAGYAADRFYNLYSGLSGGAYTWGQETSVLPVNGIANRCLKVTVNTGASSVGATDYLVFRQSIEGNFLRPLFGKNMTLSFWARSSIAGVYNVSLFNGGNDKVYVATYTINSPNTFEYKTITLPLDVSSGTWYNNTNVGLYIQFVLASGANYNTSTPNTWLTSSYKGASTGTNSVSAFATTTGATFYISQIMLNEGQSAAPFSLMGKNFTGELALCQRYYEKTYDYDTIPGTNTTNGLCFTILCTDNTGYNWAYIPFQVQKRTPPSSVNLWTSSGVASNTERMLGAGTGYAQSGTATGDFGTRGFVQYQGGVGNGVIGQWRFHWSVDVDF